MHRIYLKNHKSNSFWICDLLDDKKIGKITAKGKIKLKKNLKKKVQTKLLKTEIKYNLKKDKQAWTDKYLAYLKKYNQQFIKQFNDNTNYSFPAFTPAIRLKKCAKDMFSREVYLHPRAKKAWLKMQKAAKQQGIDLQIISAYRTLAYQKELILKKQSKGMQLADILKVNTLPGYSEHHTGCAIDIGSANAAILEAEFDQSPAFKWLIKNANSYNFYLSYPKHNSTGICYEPWHWCYRKLGNNK